MILSLLWLNQELPRFHSHHSAEQQQQQGILGLALRRGLLTLVTGAAGKYAESRQSTIHSWSGQAWARGADCETASRLGCFVQID